MAVDPVLTILLLAVGTLAAVLGALALLCCGIRWAVTAYVERRTARRVDKHAEQAAAITRPQPLPRRKAPTAARLRGDAVLAAIEAELDAEYRRLEDLYLT